MGGFLPEAAAMKQFLMDVSVPSRGMGGFLQKYDLMELHKSGRFRPLSRYGWFPTTMDRNYRK